MATFNFPLNMNQNPNQSLVGSMGTAPVQPSAMQPQQAWWQNANTWGNIGTAAQGVGALAQGWLGFQQLDLAKDQLAFQKDAFAKNWQNQVQLTNKQLYDQYAARQAGYGNTNVQSQDEFIAQQGVN